MSFSKAFAVPAAILVCAVVTAARADDARVSTDLQVAVQRHIEQSQIDGAILHVDADFGAVRRLYPTKAHPMVLQGRGFFVLCANLRDAEGGELEVDYYLVESATRYRVIRTEIDNRAVLTQMMSAGFVSEF